MPKKTFIPKVEPTKTPHPHDRCFRKVMGKSKIALKFLKTCIPAHIMEQIDPKSLKLVDGVFLNDAHCETRTDILYQATLKFKKGKKLSNR